MQFLKILSSFRNEIEKKEQNEIFHWLSINSLIPARG